MKHWTDNNSEFNNQMQSFKQILERKGYVSESEYVFTYQMQHDNALDDVKEWLEQNDYERDVDSLSCHGYYFPNVGAVYGLFDMAIISFDRMIELLEEEARNQGWDGIY